MQIAISGELWGKIEILSSHNLFSFAGIVSRLSENCKFLSANFLTHKKPLFIATELCKTSMHGSMPKVCLGFSV